MSHASSADRDVSIPAPTSIPIPLSRVGVWLREGLRLWGRAPFALLGISFAPFVVELLLQLIPVVGVVLSKILTPLVMGGQFVSVDRIARGERPRLGDLVLGLRRGRVERMLALSVLSSGTFLVQLLVARMIYGSDVVLQDVLLGHIGRHPESLTTAFSLTLILPGLLPAMLVAFAMPLVMLDDAGPVDAVVASVKRACSAPLAFGAFALLFAAMLTASLVTPYVGLVLVVVSSTWSLATLYAAYRDLFGSQAPLITVCAGTS